MNQSANFFVAIFKPIASFVYIFCMEFAGTFASLVCYSRIGADNMLYSSGINVGMILLVFDFPLLNPYLCTFMRFGPLLKWNDPLDGIIKWMIALIGEFCGSCSAGYFRKFLTDTYKTESLSNNYKYNTLPSTTDNSVWLLDEMFAVLFFLISLLHLIHALAPVFLDNCVWVAKPVQPSTAPGLPISLIMSIVFLVIAITHAFPSADQSLHVTLFMYFAGFRTGDVWWYRLIGGMLGTGVALLYYHLYYNNKTLYNAFVSKDTATADATPPGSVRENSKLELKLPFFRRRV